MKITTQNNYMDGFESFGERKNVFALFHGGGEEGGGLCAVKDCLEYLLDEATKAKNKSCSVYGGNWFDKYAGPAAWVYF